MPKRGANNFLISRDDDYFVVNRWSPDSNSYVQLGWLDSYQTIPFFIKACYPKQIVPVKTYVVFDINLDNEIFLLTERPLYAIYPLYDYEKWSFNGKYRFGSLNWKRIMDYKVYLRRMSHAS